MVNQKPIIHVRQPPEISIIPHDRVFPRSLVTTNILLLIHVIIIIFFFFFFLFFHNLNILFEELLNTNRLFKVLLIINIWFKALLSKLKPTPRHPRPTNRPPPLLYAITIPIHPQQHVARNHLRHQRLPRLPLLRDAGRPDARRLRRRRPLLLRPASLTTTPSSVMFPPRLPTFSALGCSGEAGGGMAGIVPPPLLLQLILPMWLPPFHDHARDDSDRFG